MMDWVTNTVASAGLAGVFLLMLAENLFPPIPSELIMPLAGFSACRITRMMALFSPSASLSPWRAKTDAARASAPTKSKNFLIED